MCRIQKVLAQHGVASRRAAEQLVLEGRVRINGEVAGIGAKTSKGDEILLDGRPLGHPEKITYVLLHKPRGYVTTVKDTHNRRTVLDLLPDLGARLYPVGRLDKDTEGLLLLTNDGELCNRLLHPSKQISKTYFVEVAGHLPPAAVAAFRQGIELADGPTLPAKVESVSMLHSSTSFLLTIREGRNRQIRRMCTAVGLSLLYLKRVALGPLTLSDLPVGSHRYLSEDEVKALYDAVGSVRNG